MPALSSGKLMVGEARICLSRDSFIILIAFKNYIIGVKHEWKLFKGILDTHKYKS